ncbi:MAG: flavodoxin family protein [Thermoplasmatota archaeon]
MARGALIVYMSIHHGNTEQVAEAMADQLDAALQQPDETSVDDVAGADLVGFGSGIYFWRHHRSLLRLAGELPAMPGKRVFLFSTSGIGPGWLWHHALRRRLRRKGFAVIDEYSCRGHDTYGLLRIVGGIHKNRPDRDDLKRARRFAARLAP